MAAARPGAAPGVPDAGEPGTLPAMTARISNLSFDSVQPEVTGAFWAAALGWPLDADNPDEVAVTPAPDAFGHGVLPDLLFLRVPEGKVVKNRLHVDLRSDGDQAAEVARLEGLGARRVDIGQGDDVSWVVMADPEGNEFCVLRSPHAPGSSQPDLSQPEAT